MATKVLTTLQDDIDGSNAVETVRFGLDGVEWEIDLSERNANRLRNSLSDFISHGRKVGGQRRRKAGNSSSEFDPKAVRSLDKAAASKQGRQVGLSCTVAEAFHRAAAPRPWPGIMSAQSAIAAGRAEAYGADMDATEHPTEDDADARPLVTELRVVLEVDDWDGGWARGWYDGWNNWGGPYHYRSGHFRPGGPGFWNHGGGVVVLHH